MPTELEIVAKIKQLTLSNTPAAAILRRPGHQLWLQPLNAAQNAQAVAENVYWYGHNGPVLWTWGAGSGGNPTGEALARGQVATTNCGGFNATVRWIGCNVLGLDPNVFVGSYTLANEYFITRGNTISIDRNWHGNVRTLTHDFHQVGAYFFMGHSWSKYNANMLDASTNVMNFNVKTDLYSFLLNNVYNEAGNRAFTVAQTYTAFPIPDAAPYACIGVKCLKHFQHLFPIVWMGAGHGVTQGFINAMPLTTGNNWEAMLMVSIAGLSVAFRNAVGV